MRSERSWIFFFDFVVIDYTAKMPIHGAMTEITDNESVIKNTNWYLRIRIFHRESVPVTAHFQWTHANMLIESQSVINGSL